MRRVNDWKQDPYAHVVDTVLLNVVDAKVYISVRVVIIIFSAQVE
jgi:hypothetical protein